MKIYEGVAEILSEVMDIDKDDIAIDSYIVRDLDVESIDFLEIAVELNNKFNLQVSDNTIFLKSLRLHIENGGKEALREYYPYLNKERIDDILNDYKKGPVLKVSDIVDYVGFYGVR